jgi:cell division protein FtsW (lipid II flippase)
MTKRDIILNWLTNIGLLVIAAGALLPIIYGPQSFAYRYVFSAGALILLVSRLFTKCDSKVLRVKRLFRIQAWSSIFFCCAAFFMFYSNTPQDWLAFTLAGAAIQLYASIAIPMAEKKALRDQQRYNNPPEQK